MDNLPIALTYDRKNFMRIQRARLRDELNPFDIDEARFRELYRLPKGLAITLINSIEVHFNRQAYHTAIPAHLQILTALHFYATGGYQRQLGMNFLTNMSQTKVSNSIRTVSRILSNNLLNEYVHFPNNEEEVSSVKNIFYIKTGISGIIGIIDGTHVKICGLKKAIENMYVNRKGFHSINVQIVCNHELRIINVNARYPGSSHDSFIFNNSHLLHHLKYNYLNKDDKFTWLLGDSGYALQPWLITPFNRSSDASQTAFNKKHASVRSTVERCIGLLKVRFRCLLEERGMRYDPTIVGHTINACCVLHNLMVSIRPNEFEEEEISRVIALERDMQHNGDIEEVEGETIRQKGIRSRNWLMDRICSN